MDKVGSGLIYAHHVTITAMGVWGLVEGPSPSVVAAIGGAAAAWLWSALFVLFGVAAFWCRFSSRVGLRWRGEWIRLDTSRSEAMCIHMIGLAYFLFGLIVFSAALHAANDSGAGQTGLGLLAASMFLPGAAFIHMGQLRRHRLASISITENHKGEILTGVAEELRRDTTQD